MVSLRVEPFTFVVDLQAVPIAKATAGSIDEPRAVIGRVARCFRFELQVAAFVIGFEYLLASVVKKAEKNLSASGIGFELLEHYWVAKKVV